MFNAQLEKIQEINETASNSKADAFVERVQQRQKSKTLQYNNKFKSQLLKKNSGEKYKEPPRNFHAPVNSIQKTKDVINIFQPKTIESFDNSHLSLQLDNPYIPDQAGPKFEDDGQVKAYSILGTAKKFKQILDIQKKKTSVFHPQLQSQDISINSLKNSYITRKRSNQLQSLGFGQNQKLRQLSTLNSSMISDTSTIYQQPIKQMSIKKSEIISKIKEIEERLKRCKKKYTNKQKKNSLPYPISYSEQIPIKHEKSIKLQQNCLKICTEKAKKQFQDSIVFSIDVQRKKDELQKGLASLSQNSPCKNFYEKSLRNDEIVFKPAQKSLNQLLNKKNFEIIRNTNFLQKAVEYNKKMKTNSLIFKDYDYLLNQTNFLGKEATNDNSYNNNMSDKVNKFNLMKPNCSEQDLITLQVEGSNVFENEKKCFMASKDNLFCSNLTNSGEEIDNQPDEIIMEHYDKNQTLKMKHTLINSYNSTFYKEV